MLDKAESTEDVEDQAQAFRDSEPEIWDRLAAWHGLYKSRNLLVEELQAIVMPDKFKELMLNFPSANVVVSEKEKLETLKMRKEMGIDTMIEILMKDNPSLTEEQAEAKLAKILKEKIERVAMFGEQNMDADGKCNN